MIDIIPQPPLPATAAPVGSKATQPGPPRDKLSGRPDFTILIYPAYLVTKDMTALTPMIAVNDKTPPAFLAHAYDDGVTADSSVQYFLALKRNKVSAELHVYSKGGHGYGMRPSPNAVVTWPKRCEDWLKAGGWVK